MKIGVCSFAFGEKYKDAVKYGIITKKLYCRNNNYTFIDDENFLDHTRDYQWSKIPVILQFIKDYDYIVWIDADSFIMNNDVKLETFITRMEERNKKLMYASDGHWVNTGVMFIKNCSEIVDFFNEAWNRTNEICHEQGAIDVLWRHNWKQCKEWIEITPDQTEYNSCWYKFRWGQFILHFPGFFDESLPKRENDCLKKMMNLFCPIKMENETEEKYIRRIIWLKYACHIELPIIKNECNRLQRYTPLIFFV